MLTPVSSAIEVTPNDSADLAQVCRGFMVGVSGDVVVDMGDNGDTILLKNCVQGTFYEMIIKRIRATNTTATDIVAFY